MLGLGILSFILTFVVWLLTYSWYEAKCADLRRIIRSRNKDAKEREETITSQRREILRLRLCIENQRDEHAEETAALRAEITGLKSREKAREDIKAAWNAHKEVS